MSSASLRLALFGKPLGQSRSRDLFAEARRHGAPPIDYRPVEVDVQGLRAGIDAIRRGDLDGANVTVPHKIRAAEGADRLTPEAAGAGAVNVLFRGDLGEVVGANTDGAGFLHSIGDAAGHLGRCAVLVLGAGGAARGVVQVLSTVGSSIEVATRATQQEGPGSDHLRARGARLVPWERESLRRALAAADVVVQATPVGSSTCREETLDLPIEALRGGVVAVDLVYAPWETDFLARVRRRGARGLNGWPMLVEQAALALDLWSGAGAGEAVRRGAERLEVRDPWAGVEAAGSA